MTAGQHWHDGRRCRATAAGRCRSKSRVSAVIDPMVVERLIAGRHTGPRTTAELAAAVRALRRTRSIAETARTLRCNPSTVARHQQAE